MSGFGEKIAIFGSVGVYTKFEVLLGDIPTCAFTMACVSISDGVKVWVGPE